MNGDFQWLRAVGSFFIELVLPLRYSEVHFRMLSEQYHHLHFQLNQRTTFEMDSREVWKLHMIELMIDI